MYLHGYPTLQKSAPTLKLALNRHCFCVPFRVSFCPEHLYRRVRPRLSWL
jgi:hypothetical protein